MTCRTDTALSIRNSLYARYPNAKVFLLDEHYDVPPRGEIEKLYKKFQNKMRATRLTAWVKNKGDCDKWAWLFKAFVTVRNWLSPNKNALPVGFICYNIGGKERQGHAINMYLETKGDTRYVRELEPQPGHGTKELTRSERKSVWLVVL